MQRLKLFRSGGEMKNKKEMKSVFGVIWSFVLLLLLGGQAFAATYYVSPSGNDSSSGSVNAPFRSIQKAADIVNPGDTVIVKNGVYTDTNGDGMIVNLNREGTSSNWITFKSENKWGAVLNGQSQAADYCWFNSTNARYIRIEDFEMEGCVKGLHSNSGANNHDFYIYRNNIHDIGRVTANDSNGRSAAFAGYDTYNFTFDSNLFHSIGRLNPYTTPSATEASCTNATGQIKCYSQDHAIYLYGHDHTIINNIFHDIKSGWAIQVSGGTGTADGPNWNIINNTFYGANPKKDGQIMIWTQTDGTMVTNVTIQNNISSGATYGFVTTLNNVSGSSTWYLYNNLVYGASNLIKKGDHSIPSHVASGNIIGQDPKFVNLTNRDFHLQSSSPAINKGVYIDGYDYDADGNPIVGAPDVGAYEYAGAQTDTVSPSVPNGLTAAAVSTSQIDLAWTASTDNIGVTGYKIYRNGTQIGTSVAASYSDTRLAASTSYTYTVSAFDAAGNFSAQSASVSAKTMTPPDTQAPTVPTGLKATAVSTSEINLTWTASTDNVGVTGYKIYKNGDLIATMLTTGYSDTGLAASTSYTYKVSAFDAAGNVSAQSASASATTTTPPDTQAPTVPSNLIAAAVSTSQINLAWTASTDNIGVTGYKIYRNGTQIGTSTAVSYSDTGLPSSTSYTYTVSAFDAAGNVSAQTATVFAASQSVEQLSADTIIIDNNDPGTSYSGTWQISDGADPYGTNSLWGSGKAKYTWTFKPKTSGIYEVSMWWTEWSTRSTDVPVTILYAGSKTTLRINQQVNGGQWNSLNSYYFKAGKTYKVIITAQAAPASACADAVKFTYVGAN